MTYLESPRLASEKATYRQPEEHISSKVNMSDHNISPIFRRPNEGSGVLSDNHLNVSSPYGSQDFFDRIVNGKGQSCENVGSNQNTEGHNFVMRCDTTSTSSTGTDTGAGGSDATTSSGSTADAFMQQLNQSDPTLAKLLTDAQQQMSAAGASQLEANVISNFNQNNGQFPTDSSLMNASIGQLDGQGVASSDIVNAQNSVISDIANPNIGDAPVSNFNSGSSSSDSGPSSSSDSGSSNCGSSDSSSCPSGSSDCSSSGGADSGGSGSGSGGSDSGGSGSSDPLQQALSQLLQDLESGNFQQFLQDLIKDLPALEAASKTSATTGTGSTADSPSTSTVAGTLSNPATKIGDATTTTPVTTATTAAIPGAVSSPVSNITNNRLQVTTH